MLDHQTCSSNTKSVLKGKIFEEIVRLTPIDKTTLNLFLNSKSTKKFMEKFIELKKLGQYKMQPLMRTFSGCGKKEVVVNSKGETERV